MRLEGTVEEKVEEKGEHVAVGAIVSCGEEFLYVFLQEMGSVLFEVAQQRREEVAEVGRRVYDGFGLFVEGEQDVALKVVVAQHQQMEQVDVQFVMKGAEFGEVESAVLERGNG